MIMGPEQAGVLKEMVENILFDTRVAIPCVVTSFVQDAGEEPYVNVVPSIRRTKYTSGRGVEFVETTEIEEVPIAYLSTQEFGLSIPIKAGDRGYLVHADYDMDTWNVDGDEIADPDNTRFHDLNDCVFFPGPWPRPHPMNGYSDEWFEMRDMPSTHRVALSENMVHLQALQNHFILSDSGVDLTAGSDTLMQILIDLLKVSAGLAGCATGCSAFVPQFVEISARVLAMKGSSSPPTRPQEPVSR